MKFTDGFWQLRPGVTALYAQEAYDIEETGTVDGPGLVITAPTKAIAGRGDTLNRPVLTTTLSSPADGVIRVRIAHHEGGHWHGGFELPGASASGAGTASVTSDGGALVSGPLTARVAPGAPWNLAFEVDGRRVTGSGHKSQGYLRVDAGAEVDRGIVGNARAGSPAPAETAFVHEQLELGVGELIYGLGERFGPLVKNGQSVEIWNADGGTSSEQA
jgi:alpha-D-xyloside xylohydrolase